MVKVPDANTRVLVPEEFKPLIEDLRGLVKDGQNPNQMSKSRREALWRSLMKFGWFKPLLVDGEGLLGDGEQRLEACLSHEEFYAPVLRLDIDDKDRRLLRQVANKLIGKHDPDLDAAEYRRIVADGGQQDLVQILQLREKELREALENVNPKLDDYKIPALDEVETDIELGDIFQLGTHRIICGDATDPKYYSILMKKDKADCMFTDPPYNVDYSEKTEYMNRVVRRGYTRTPIEGDKISDLYAFLYDWLQAMKNHLAEYNSIYITFAEKNLRNLLNALHATGYYHSQTLVWNKNAPVLGRSDYNYKHEPIVYCWLGKHKFYGTKERTVWDIPKPYQSNLHPTMKPVELVERSIVNSTLPDMTVLDTFHGSGTTLIACEKTVRRCLAIEIEPRYVQIAIDRWKHYTGKEAHRMEETGGTP